MWRAAYRATEPGEKKRRCDDAVPNRATPSQIDEASRSPQKSEADGPPGCRLVLGTFTFCFCTLQFIIHAMYMCIQGHARSHQFVMLYVYSAHFALSCTCWAMLLAAWHDRAHALCPVDDVVLRLSLLALAAVDKVAYEWRARWRGVRRSPCWSCLLAA